MSSLLLSALLLIQGQRVRTERFFEKPIDESYAIVLMRDWTREGAYESMAVRVVLQSRSDRNLYWNLEKFERVTENYSFVRADRNSAVLFYHNDYGFGDYVKLFFDAGSKRLLKRISFNDTGFSQVPTSDSLRVLGISAELLGELITPPALESLLPEGLLPGFPQSTYEEFA